MYEFISCCCCLLSFEPVLRFLCEKVGYVWSLEDNVVELRSELNDLIATRDGVLNRVKAGELKGQQRLHNVANWLLQVEKAIVTTNQLIDAPQGQGCCSMDNISNCSYAGKVVKKLKEIEDLSGKGKFDEVVGKATPPVVELRDVEQTFGLDRMLEKTWESLMNDNIRILSIYGMGGIGKTTLLALINNKCVEPAFKDHFDVVIWVKVSKDVDIGKIQDDIAIRLGLYDEKWRQGSQREKADSIFRVLLEFKPRFLLLLDDLWKQLSFQDIGIPPIHMGGKRCKILFTTRSRDVSGAMQPQVEIEATFLAEEDAVKLFLELVGGHRLDEQTKRVATKIAVKCHGLPLALKVIARSMSSRARSATEWRRLLETVSSESMSGIKSVEKDFFSVLKVSYDDLQDNDAKSCCRYCALFPEAYNARDDELVEYWISEGIIDNKTRGYEIISGLVDSCLLVRDEDETCHMHDMIREMALWITKIEVGEEYFVKTGGGLREQPKGADWKTVTKMSLMDNEIKSIDQDPEFPHPARLMTLFLQNNKLEKIASEFFPAVSTLLVLDLSNNLNVTSLPEEISSLVALKYLSLSGTRIECLPSSFDKLDKLIHLDLEFTSELVSISSVSKLQNLQVLRFCGSSAALDISLLKYLEGMKRLQVLTITVKKEDVLQAFLISKVAGKTQGLYLEELAVSVASLGSLGKLRYLKMVRCDITESASTLSSQTTSSYTWLEDVSTVVLDSCKTLKDLTWLMSAENLESLTIKVSTDLEQIIDKDKAVGEPSFQKLQVLDLDDLSALKSIYWTPLSLPRLKKVYITECQQLPVDSISVTQILVLTSR